MKADIISNQKHRHLKNIYSDNNESGVKPEENNHKNGGERSYSSNNNLQNRMESNYKSDKGLQSYNSKQSLLRTVGNGIELSQQYQIIDKNQNQYTNENMKSKSLKKHNSQKVIQPLQYKRLHEKLNNIQSRISQMKINLQKKRQQKIIMLEKQKIEREKYNEKRKNQLKQYQLKNKQKSQMKKYHSNNLQEYKSNQKNKTQMIDLSKLVTKAPQHRDLKSFDINPYSPRHNIYYVSQIVRAYKDQKSIARQHIKTSLQILKVLQKSKSISNQQIKNKSVTLKRKYKNKDKKTVIFDLDQTLIHCNDNINQPYDIKLPIKFPTGQILEAGINIRPYSKEILRNLSQKYELIIFTASHSCYANVVIDYLDPKGQYIDHRLFRQNCHQTQSGMYVKDLRIINRQMSQMVLIDNAAYSYAYQLDNGIPILPYYYGNNDYELRELQKYIFSLLFSHDVRINNRNTFKLNQYLYFNHVNQLVEKLYS